MIEIGTMTPGTSIAFSSRKKRKTTMITRPTAITNVCSVSTREARMVAVRSPVTFISVPPGIDAFKTGRIALMRSTVLRVAQILAPPGVEVILYEGLGVLPHFNPDLDGDESPQLVLELRSEVGLADGLLISSPEYAHGVPGSLKNALDWLVASVEFPNKAVALLNTSPRATHALAQLTEILTTMSARLIPAASLTFALPLPIPPSAGL